jgi:hypothetical protein
MTPWIDFAAPCRAERERYMRPRLLASVGFFALITCVASLASVDVAAQTPTTSKSTAAKKEWTPPRTPDGQPDLQGVWDYRTVTPLERPDDLAGKAVLTDAEAAEYERQQAATRNRDRRDGSAQADVQRAYNYALSHALEGSRNLEKAAEVAKKKGSR